MHPKDHRWATGAATSCDDWCKPLTSRGTYCHMNVGQCGTEMQEAALCLLRVHVYNVCSVLCWQEGVVLASGVRAG